MSLYQSPQAEPSLCVYLINCLELKFMTNSEQNFFRTLFSFQNFGSSSSMPPIELICIYLGLKLISPHSYLSMTFQNS